MRCAVVYASIVRDTMQAGSGRRSYHDNRQPNADGHTDTQTVERRTKRGVGADGVGWWVVGREREVREKKTREKAREDGRQGWMDGWREGGEQKRGGRKRIEREEKSEGGGEGKERERDLVGGCGEGMIVSAATGSGALRQIIAAWYCVVKTRNSSEW